MARRFLSSLATRWRALVAFFVRTMSPSPSLAPRFTPLPTGSSVVRVLGRKPHFFHPPDFREPKPEVFKPNSRDIEEGAARGRPPGVSVFDCSGCSVADAVLIRTRQGGRPLGEVIALKIGVDDVRRIGRAYNPAVDVVADPIETSEGRVLDLPGADAHALIEGLHEVDRSRRRSPDYKALLDRLATTAERLQG